MKHCIFCAEELDNDAKFCSKCGKDLRKEDGTENMAVIEKKRLIDEILWLLKKMKNWVKE